MKRNKILLILLLLVFAVAQIFAQEIGLKGNVASADGEDLIGVTITVKGSNRGVTTDVNGDYVITVKKGDVLVFSYIGFSTVERTVTNNNLDVVMEPSSEMLAEVVTVGYGIQKKVDMTGSVSTVQGDVLLKAPTPNLANALTGKMTGVITTQQTGKPGLDDPAFFIRGKQPIHIY
ncbi:exported hypothetical protein [uncultured Dysgonomonas sp.]|uniref:TonB-dependent receptor plug domain-containing protein n=1 Tax=uncultured Dysgonomonas sp. TaxID=206096 RepID=A0A212IZT0_9BACT|nr:carboxypeptidase-like regulatory domain-containing protein [uncultured Dysgonomonas sp.]SBV92699.1 exported hypothetical protein [uncultured Dysgonomonas sp.]